MAMVTSCPTGTGGGLRSCVGAEIAQADAHATDAAEGVDFWDEGGAHAGAGAHGR